jgi:DNA invertase Pin-like site-specific DNA recombinase
MVNIPVRFSSPGRVHKSAHWLRSWFERSLIRERTRTGLAAARPRGRSGGRKPTLGEMQVRQITALPRDPDIQVADVARRFGVSRTTLYKQIGVIAPRNANATTS